MPSSDVALSRSLDDVDEQLDRGYPLYARIRCADGNVIEGEIIGVGDADLIVLDAGDSETRLSTAQILALDISAPRRLREWLIALYAIPVVTAIIVGIAVALSRIPGVDPERGVMIAFVIFMALVWAVGRVPGLRAAFRRKLTTWNRVYPPRGT